MPDGESDLREVGIKELTVHASAVIARVEQGQRVVVTRRRRPAALLIPFSDARDFVLAFADDFIEMRRLARDDRLLDAANTSPDGWSVQLTETALREVRRPSFPGRPAWRLLRQLAARAEHGAARLGGRWRFVHERSGEFAWATAGQYVLMCDVRRQSRTVALLAVFHKSLLTRWIWSGRPPPLRVTVATHLDGTSRRNLEDAD
jgi:prevent-host-death family protein